MDKYFSPWVPSPLVDENAFLCLDDDKVIWEVCQIRLETNYDPGRVPGRSGEGCFALMLF